MGENTTNPSGHVHRLGQRQTAQLNLKQNNHHLKKLHHLVQTFQPGNSRQLRPPPSDKAPPYPTLGELSADVIRVVDLLENFNFSKAPVPNDNYTQQNSRHALIRCHWPSHLGAYLQPFPKVWCLTAW